MFKDIFHRIVLTKGLEKLTIENRKLIEYIMIYL